MKRDIASPVVVAALLTALLWSDGAPGWSWGEQAIQAGAAWARQVAAGSTEVVLVRLSLDKEAQ